MESPIITYLRGVLDEFSELRDGEPYPVNIPGGSIDPDDFAIALATVDGQVYEVGDSDKEFLLQSLSKPLSYALALSDLGAEAVDAKVDVEPSGDPFHEMSLAEETGRPANAMINAGAIAIASLIKGSGGRSAIRRIVDTYSACAGRTLRTNGRAYQGERAISDRNHALAYLLSSVGVIEGRPSAALETYLRQCTVQVTTRDLAMIGATLANGGTNPVTGVEALDPQAVERTLSVMMTSGMYDDAGDWVARVGMPAKSGVGGGIMAVLPGQAGLAVFSPPLDQHGNSVRGTATSRRVSQDMELHFVRSARAGRSAIRSTHTIDRVPSRIRRTEEASAVLAEHSQRAVVVELSGDLFFAGTESVVRELSDLPDDVEMAVLDLRRVNEVGPLALSVLPRTAERFEAEGRQLILVDPDGLIDHAFGDEHTHTFDDHDLAIIHCERTLLERYGAESMPAEVPIEDAPALAMLDADDLRVITALMEPVSYDSGEVIRRVGQRFAGVFFILSGAVSTIASDAEGNRFRLSTLSAGMMIGDLALADTDRQETTVKAESDTRALLLSADAIATLETDDPDLAVRLWRALAREAYVRVDAHARAVAARIRETAP